LRAGESGQQGGGEEGGTDGAGMVDCEVHVSWIFEYERILIGVKEPILVVPRGVKVA
jgi:hypothetical protein